MSTKSDAKKARKVAAMATTTNDRFIFERNRILLTAVCAASRSRFVTLLFPKTLSNKLSPRLSMGISSQGQLDMASGNEREHEPDRRTEGAEELSHKQGSDGVAPVPPEHTLRMGTDEPDSGCAFRKRLSL